MKSMSKMEMKNVNGGFLVPLCIGWAAVVTGIAGVVKILNDRYNRAISRRR